MLRSCIQRYPPIEQFTPENRRLDFYTKLKAIAQLSKIDNTLINLRLNWMPQLSWRLAARHPCESQK